ncbi:Protein of unknown function [Sphingobium sp. AP50]|uniref:DUF3768 domain-containing protein n=1 Tax=Sphingobium sp. AP50 TaxID=1884369 RepID=UPI0008D8C6FD|nr:DUF3768 domain-containing protein [Sphingobium sp. AP50]SEJ80644.1 Protein of unknown function [Sphingobium sp. AP50]
MPDSQPSPALTGPVAIAALNDALRTNPTQPGHNGVVMTAGVADLIGDASLFRNFHRRAVLLRQVRDHDDFSVDNDPHGERDFGRFEFEGAVLYWKIDYYDRSLEFGSPNPADPNVTTRVLTILLADEY